MTTATKQPFLPLFFGDFLGATAEWEGEEQALYLLLLGYQWSLGSIPSDTRKLCRLVKFSESVFNAAWTVVSTKFDDIGDGRLLNHRLEAHRSKTIELGKKNSESGKKGAEARWRNNGERHAESMASATNSASDRHQSANGVTDGNPSHPIPSHPNPESVVTLSHPDTHQPENAARSPAKANGAKQVSPKPRSTRRMPVDWPITDVQEWAIVNTPFVDFDIELAKIRDHQFRDAHSDWDAVIRNWLRRAEGNGKPNGHSKSSARKTRTAEDTEHDYVVRYIAEGKTDEEIDRELDGWVTLERIRDIRKEVEHAQH